MPFVAHSGPALTRGWGSASTLALLVAGTVFFSLESATSAATSPPGSLPKPSTTNSQPPPPPELGPGDAERLEVAHAVMVTVELDFGPKVPTIAEALLEIERRSEPEQGSGRTFAILDAYGEPTADGKLHLSMHVSTEKSGVASLRFKRTGEVLWTTRIFSGTNAPAANFASRGLVILLDNGAGRTVAVDGSNNPRSILEAKVKEMAVTVADIWPEGSEREVSFLYSACGCPVKVMCMRTGDKTARTRNLPVIFPDDPAVLSVIKRLMQWN